MTQSHTPLHWKLVIDAADPHAQADFWAAALRYEVEDNSALIERLLGFGAVSPEITVESHGRKAWRDLVAVRHPEDPYDKESGTAPASGCSSNAYRSRRRSRTGCTSTYTPSPGNARRRSRAWRTWGRRYCGR